MEIPFLDKLDLSPEMKSRLAAIAASEGPELKVAHLNTGRPAYKITLGDLTLSWEEYPNGVIHTSITYGKFSPNMRMFRFHREDGSSYILYLNGVMRGFDYQLNGVAIDPDAVRDLLGETPIDFTPEQAMLFNLTFGGK